MARLEDCRCLLGEGLEVCKNMVSSAYNGPTLYRESEKQGRSPKSIRTKASTDRGTKTLNPNPKSHYALHAPADPSNAAAAHDHRASSVES